MESDGLTKASAGTQLRPAVWDWQLFAAPIATGGPFSGRWLCGRGSFYGGVPIQVEFDGLPDEWAPMAAHDTDVSFEKAELVALFDLPAGSAELDPASHGAVSAATHLLLPIQSSPPLRLLKGEAQGRCYVVSKGRHANQLRVSVGFGATGHVGEVWTLSRVRADGERGGTFGGGAFGGWWRCDASQLFDGNAIAIGVGGDPRRWSPRATVESRGEAERAYVAHPLIDLVEVSAISGRRHHIASLSDTEQQLTVSLEYGSAGHRGETWTLRRAAEVELMPYWRLGGAQLESPGVPMQLSRAPPPRGSLAPLAPLAPLQQTAGRARGGPNPNQILAPLERREWGGLGGEKSVGYRAAHGFG